MALDPNHSIFEIEHIIIGKILFNNFHEEKVNNGERGDIQFNKSDGKVSSSI